MRLASLSPAATEIVWALGKGRDVVCTDQFSNWPDEAKTLPHLRDHQTIDPEALHTHAPELTLTGTVVQEKLATTLRAAGFAVAHQDPRLLSEVWQAVRQLGTILDAEPEAERVVLQMQQALNAVQTKARLLPRRPKVYVEEWHRPPMASGNWVPEIVRIAGGEPFPIPPGQLSREVTLAEVVKFDPDLIVISWCGAAALADKALLLERAGWQDVRAVKQGAVRVIDDSLLNRPGPRLAEGAQRIYGWLFELTH